MISSYGDQSTTQGIILHIIVLHQRCLEFIQMLQRHLMFYTCNYNIRVLSVEMVLLSIFFTNRIHGGIINELFFIHFVAPYLLFI